MVAVTVVVPTLAADDALDECLASLDRQRFRDFEVVVVDNSCQRKVRFPNTIHNATNVGFGAAINQGWRQSQAKFIATLNDDAVAGEEWLSSLLTAMDDPRVGMCASQVRIAGSGKLDSAGMLIARDGSSKQRGHLRSVEANLSADALFPSGSAALYRRSMLDEIGGFAEEFFLYCEDTDLGLRARRAGWRCVYVQQAVVDHRYSHSAGRASALKAYLVERNRLWTVVRNFPVRLWPGAWLASAARFFWHAWFGLRGHGTTASALQQTGMIKLIWLIKKAHLVTLVRLPRLLSERQALRRTARLSSAEFAELLAAHRISVREVASL